MSLSVSPVESDVESASRLVRSLETKVPAPVVAAATGVSGIWATLAAGSDPAAMHPLT